MALEDTEGMVPEEPIAPEPVEEPVPEPVTIPEPIPEPAATPEPEPAPAYSYNPRPTAGPTPEPSASSDAGASFRKGLHDVAGKAAAWLNGWFPGQGNTVLFGIVGLLLALLFFKIGVWRSLVIAFLVVCGVAFGQYLDGDPKILRFVRDLLNKGE